MQRDTGKGGSIAQAATVFTKAEETLFARRFSEGYDLKSDLKYMQWLHLNHPEKSDRDLNDSFLDVPPAEPSKFDTAIILSLSSPCAYNADHKKSKSLSL